MCTNEQSKTQCKAKTKLKHDDFLWFYNNVIIAVPNYFDPSLLVVVYIEVCQGKRY